MNKRGNYASNGFMLSMLLVVGLCLGVVGTASAQVEIPEGATIDWATLSIYSYDSSGYTVNVHRVTADWQELSVTWNSFGGSYDASIVASFVPNTWDWNSIDVTDLVRDWYDGTVPNYGFLLEQGETLYANYASSESSNIGSRPMLEIGYTTTNGSFSVIIQRPGTEQGNVADTYIVQPFPDQNNGDEDVLYTGLYSGWLKQTLLRFDFTSAPPRLGCGGLTPGFWQNKHGLGLIEEYGLLGMLNDLCLADADGYVADFATLKQFKCWIKDRDAVNMAYQLSGQLAAMELNVAVGSVDGGALVYIGHEGDMISINDLLSAAEDALCEDGYTPVGDDNRDYQEWLKDALDDANNNLNWVYPCSPCSD